MAEPMRESPLRDSSHRGKVADPSCKKLSKGATSPPEATAPGPPPPAPSNNFDDDNEWDIGIGDLIIDLDADIEKTTDTNKPATNNNSNTNNNNMASTGANAKTASAAQPKVAAGSGATPSAAAALAAAVAAGEHSATVDKGLKMKIKRTKPGTKEAKHEIVKAAAEPHGPAATNGDTPAVAAPATAESPAKAKSASSSTSSSSSSSSSQQQQQQAAKRGSSGHRRDKSKHSSSSSSTTTPTKAEVNGATPPGAAAVPAAVAASPQVPSDAAAAPAPPPLVFPSPAAAAAPAASAATPKVPAASKAMPPVAAAAAVAAADNGQLLNKVPASGELPSPAAKCVAAAASPAKTEDSSASPPPSKKLKTLPLVNCTTNGTADSKVDVSDVCVGTSVGTITEPDCLGPCEPGTSVTLEGIVWNETEGGVLVVNVTWRGKTYVGTLLDCTKHDWAPPRFCDSPTSDLDARTPKGRGKRGRGAAAAPTTDLSNFTETRSSVHSKLRNGAKGRRGAAGSPAPPSVPAFPRPEAGGAAGAATGGAPAVAKRKGRPPDSSSEESKRSRSGSRGPTASPPASPVLLECPEPNCSKKYKHINGLKYHQSHAHGSAAATDDDADSKDVSETEEGADAPSVPPSPKDKKEASPEPPAKPLSPPVAVVAAAAVVVAAPEEPPPPKPPVLNVPTPPKPPPPAPAQEEPKLADKYKVKIPSPPLKVVVPPPAVLAPVVVSKPVAAPEAVPAKAAAPTTPKKKKVGSPVPESLNGFAPKAPTPPVLLQQPLQEGREEVQSPAYSDISDDGAPVDAEDKAAPGAKPLDKKPDAPLGAPYGMYPYYGQPQYLAVPEKPKEDKELKLEKEKKDEFSGGGGAPPPPQQQKTPHFYPYAYYPYNLDAASFPVAVDKYQEQEKEVLKIKEEKVDKVKSIKLEPKEKRDENHQILKESIEMKSQMADKKFYDYPYQMYHQRQQDDLRRYYLHPDKQRKESQPLDATVQKDSHSPSSGLKKSKKQQHDDAKDKKEEKKQQQQEGVKPTMETQGPPPPTNSYGYFNQANYMQAAAAAHYGSLPFDPNHPVYRGMSPMLVPGPYGATPYLHAPMRYPGPEDLSRGPPPPAAPTKALDMLQHHASQYAYSSHKIHELQERALKSPQPPPPASKGGGAASPAAVNPQAPAGPPPVGGGPPRPSSGGGPPPGSAPGSGAPSKQQPPGGPGAPGLDKEPGAAPAPMRSPPPQRHVHTHHHTHVGLGYPILPGQYPTPYGAAVLTTQQVAATGPVVSPGYPPTPAPK